MRAQNGIFVEGTTEHWFLEFAVSDPSGVVDAIQSVRSSAAGATDGERVELVVAFGPTLARRLLADVPGEFRDFDGVVGPDRHAPTTPVDLFFWIHSDRHDRNFEVALETRRAVDPIGSLIQEVPGWRYRDDRNLFGFIDGTENPDADTGRSLALVRDGPGVGGAFVFVQRWIHDLDRFHALDVPDQERVIGRTKSDSVELDPLPANSHVGRVVIEDEHGNERELYRRSTPYGTAHEAGLYFLAFPDELDLIERMLERMYGIDGPPDRLTIFSRAVSGAYLFAPSEGALERLLGSAE